MNIVRKPPMKFRLKSILSAVKKRWKLVLTICVISLLGLFFTIRSRAASQITLTFEHPITQSITKTLEVSGHIDAKEKVRMRFIAGGKLTYIGAKEGDTVKKWQTIATIDKATLEKQLQQDLNNYMQERWDFEEVLDNNKDRPLTLTERRSEDKDQWDLDNTVINVEIRDIAIKNSALYAPFDGILTTAPTSVASMQVLATDYFEIVNPGTLVFRAAVDESDIATVKLDQQAMLVLDSFEDIEIPTQVNYISYTSTESSSGTAFVVEFPLSQATISELLRIGMNGDIKILLEKKDNVLTVPAIALIQRDDKTYVQVKTGKNTSEEKEITIGLETDELVEVLSGLSESDEVLIPE